MVELNKTIQWKPKSTGEGRFGNWLENMVDWNLSRDRYWGTPLPVWRSADWDAEKGTGEELCIGSLAQLTAAYEAAVKAGYNKELGLSVKDGKLEVDLHKPIVDELVLMSPSGKPMKRVHDLVDVWFDSGAMPYAQWHFPFENKGIFAQNYPADFIAEGVDQTRGWFYTLHALGALIKESVQDELKKDGFEASDAHYPGLAYKTVVSNGLVLDKDGNKMSKRLGNVVDPFETIHRFGADATRWYLITNASPWENLKFDVEGIREVQRKFFGTLYNTYQFFALYANVDGFTFKEAYVPVAERPEIDRWIISALHTLIADVQSYMDEYEPTQAGRAIEDFVDTQLSNWYVRLCRRRFWKGDYEHDKICAYQTLYECMETVLRLMAPIAPFFSDAIFNNLNQVTGKQGVASIHHSDFPKSNPALRDSGLEQRMQLAQDISSLVLSLRKKVNIKVRQPLGKVLIPILNPEMQAQVEKVSDLILSEVNVKQIQFLTDSEGFIKKKIKPNFKALGNRLGAKMKTVAAAIGAFSQEEISRLEKDKKIILILDEEPLELVLGDVEISSEDIPGWTVAVKGNLTVALDVTVTPELLNEGNARELVNRIQKIRKDSGFEVTDRVEVKIAAKDALTTSVAQFSDYICTEILADNLEIVPDIQDGIEIEVNDISLKVIVTKKGA
jgi:isoleucyl-tRNA synthetase